MGMNRRLRKLLEKAEQKKMKVPGFVKEHLESGALNHDLTPPRRTSEIQQVNALRQYLDSSGGAHEKSLIAMMEETAVSELLAEVNASLSVDSARRLVQAARGLVTDHQAALKVAEVGAMAEYRTAFASLPGRAEKVAQQAQELYTAVSELAGDDRDPNDPVSRGVSVARNLSEMLSGPHDCLKEPDVTPKRSLGK